jgi:hypothetical protein
MHGRKGFVVSQGIHEVSFFQILWQGIGMIEVGV